MIWWLGGVTAECTALVFEALQNVIVVDSACESLLLLVSPWQNTAQSAVVSTSTIAYGPSELLLNMPSNSETFFSISIDTATSRWVRIIILEKIHR